MNEFDLVVMGGGPGGYVAAIRGAQKGARVAVVERKKLGGTCLNRGCIPTKAIYHSAKALAAARRAREFGVGIGDGEPSIDLAAVIDRKDAVVEKLVGGIGQLLKANGVTVLAGSAKLDGAGRVAVTTDSGTEAIAAGKVIIATGSEPARIEAFGTDGVNVLTSTEMLDLKALPKSLLVIGGGVMGSEFASIYSTFGCRVTIVELLPTILSTEDKQIVRVVARGFKEKGVEVLTGVSVEKVEIGDGVVRTTMTGGRVVETEKVLVTIGRSFNSADIGIESAGVKTEKGRIVVNEKMETGVDGVYAIGDVIGGMLLAHVASAEGAVAAENALGGSRVMDYRTVPAGIFTDPEIASVGLKEKDAEAKGMEVRVGRFPYAASGKALGMGETDGFVQIVADPGTDRVLGASIVGAHATELIGELALAVRAGIKAAYLAETIHAHPTLPELVQEAAEDVHGMAVHKVGRKRH